MMIRTTTTGAALLLSACSGPGADLANIGLEQAAQAGLANVLSGATAAPDGSVETEEPRATSVTVPDTGSVTQMQARVGARIAAGAFDRACLQTLPRFDGSEAALRDMEFTKDGDRWVIDEEADAISVQFTQQGGRPTCTIEAYETTKTFVMEELAIFLDMRFGVTGVDPSGAETALSVGTSGGDADIKIARGSGGPAVILTVQGP